MYNGKYVQVKDSMENANYFFEKQYNTTLELGDNICLLYALNEPLYELSELDSSMQMLRFSVNPSFRIPYAVALYRTNLASGIRAKLTDGGGGYFSGLLDIELFKKMPDTFIDSIFHQLEELHFYECPPALENIGSDGDGWRIEYFDKGNYHSILRWSPTFAGDSTTQELAAIGLGLLNKSGLFAYWETVSDSSAAYKEFVLSGLK
jgi:hypothetical protein